ncbi:MAG: nicotinate-nucleotide adenylyltransferase [Acidobacteriota bacterium]
MTTKERLGLFGGSFDPIHDGHLRPVLSALRELELDRILYLPTAQPPHKPGRRFAPAVARYAMVELALLEEEALQVSPFELEEGPTYTIDTLRHFTAKERDLFLLIGADSYLELDTWRSWRELFALATIVVLARPEYDRQAPEEVRRLAADHEVLWVEHELVDISSTQVRKALRDGRTTALPVPGPVLQYCWKYKLYERGTRRNDDVRSE